MKKNVKMNNTINDKNSIKELLTIITRNAVVLDYSLQILHIASSKMKMNLTIGIFITVYSCQTSTHISNQFSD